jgi:hypothetical protein
MAVPCASIAAGAFRIEPFGDPAFGAGDKVERFGAARARRERHHDAGAVARQADDDAACLAVAAEAHRNVASARLDNRRRGTFLPSE